MTTSRIRSTIALACALLFSAAALAGPARIQIKVVDGAGKGVPDALFMFQMIDDPSQQFTVGQNDAGGYESTVKLSVDDALWSLTKVVAPGLLPAKVTLRSKSASGDIVQEVADLEVDPSNPVPPIKIPGSGTVHIDLTLGDQADVMAKFRAARAAAREEAKAEHAAAAPSGAYADAVRLYNEGDFDASIMAFQEVLRERPDDAELKVTYAGALYKAKRFKEFEAVAAESLAQNPQNPNLLMMVYSSARGRDDMTAARDALLSAKQVGGGKELLPHLTFVSQKLGATPAAIPALEAVLELDATNASAVAGLAAAHAMAGHGAKAREYLERAAKLAPGDAYKLHYDLAVKLLGKPSATPTDVDLAIALLDKAVAIKPGSAEAQRRLGMARWQREDHAGAAVALRRYLTLAPDAEDRAKIADYLNSIPK